VLCSFSLMLLSDHGFITPRYITFEKYKFIRNNKIKKSIFRKMFDQQFKVAAIGEGKCTLASYNRRDFYKISFTIAGESKLCYADQAPVELNRPALVFLNPLARYSWVGTSDIIDATGYFCIFDPAFLSQDRELVNKAEQLFGPGELPFFFLEEEHVSFISILFKRMREAVEDDMPNKEAFFRDHLRLIFYEAVRLRNAHTPKKQTEPLSRLSRRFFHLLNRQFPADVPSQVITLRKAGDFADKLSVHINHLNAAVQEATGKSTTAHINERVISEARSLLQYTDLSISEIARGLGFEYQSYFNRFFKKHTGQTPLEFKSVKSIKQPLIHPKK
jgi:AraC family transcriptional activator of pobA